MWQMAEKSPAGVAGCGKSSRRRKETGRLPRSTYSGPEVILDVETADPHVFRDGRREYSAGVNRPTTSLQGRHSRCLPPTTAAQCSEGRDVTQHLPSAAS